MPILDKSVNQYPADLLDTVEQREGDWHILLVKPRQEKAAAGDLVRLGIAFYLPLTTNVPGCAKGRNIVSYIPLFPSYVFIHANEEGRQLAIRSRRVKSVLPVPDQLGLTRDLRTLNLLLSSGLHSKSPTNAGSTKGSGSWAEFRKGSLRGARVEVSGIGSSDDRIVVMIVILGQAVRFEVPGCDLSPI